ncbi:hypothetical protein [Falsiroseomonas stagni]|uniref:ABC transporter permease n=1 Tax=Falsiroseomonas stagni DSM 19981 TaxID=1123062 RepID=A0A1I4DKX7_9PROT|nr:hypothetical protein [Falsiroseomonas stagni]SFK93027.1 hypothetical protein SAMN02745775_11123 [Falsiroseomonas stagni DSM 19981]
MLRWFRETGGDPVFLLLTWASRLRREGRWLTLAAVLTLAAILFAGGFLLLLIEFGLPRG